MSAATEAMIRDTERSEIEQYRSISGSAVIAFLGGLFSFSALAHPVMWCVPVFTTLIGVFSLRRIDRSDNLTGRWLATCGIFIALVAGSMAVSRQFFSRQVQTRHARQVAEKWFEMVRGSHDQLAHQWTMPIVLRVPANEPLDEAYQASERASTLAEFVEEQPYKTMSALDDAADYEFVRSYGVTGDNIRRYFSLEYAIDAPDSEHDGEKIHLVVLKRYDADYDLNWWQISSIRWADPNAATN